MNPLAPAAPQPTLRTPRLSLRPFHPGDAPRVRELAGDFEIADGTLTIPHPYPEGAAESWIATLGPAWERGESVVMAMVPHGESLPAGAVGLEISRAHRRGELGYWVGRPFWGRGLGTEAARAVAALALGELGLQRVTAHHLSRNPASGAVMRKLGMRHEGTLRRHILKWDELEDVEVYGLLPGELREG